MFHAYSATPTRYVNGTRETVAKLSSKRFYDLSYLIHGVCFDRNAWTDGRRGDLESREIFPSRRVNFSSCFVGF